MKTLERARPFIALPRRVVQQRARAARYVGLGAALAIAALCASERRAASAEEPRFQVIAHSDNPRSDVRREFVADAFLKKTNQWPGGGSIRPVDLPFESKVRASFSEKVIGRSVAAVRSYWQQRIFSGRGVPPPEAESEDAAVRYVRRHTGGLGYVSLDTDITGVKVLVVD